MAFIKPLRQMLGVNDLVSWRGATPTPGTNWSQYGQPQQLTGFVRVQMRPKSSPAWSIAIPDATPFGGSSILTLPLLDIEIVRVVAALTLTKDGTGYAAATAITASVGSAVAGDVTLSGTASDILDATTISTSALAVSYSTTSESNRQYSPIRVTSAASQALWLNIAGATESTNAATITVTGKITIEYIPQPTRP